MDDADGADIGLTEEGRLAREGCNACIACWREGVEMVRVGNKENLSGYAMKVFVNSCPKR